MPKFAPAPRLRFDLSESPYRRGPLRLVRNGRPRRSVARRALAYSPKLNISRSISIGNADKPGFPLGQGSAKTHTDATWQNAMTPYSVYAHSMDNIAKGSFINTRERDIAHVVGFSLSFYALNTSEVPITMRYAVISPRQTWNIASPVARSADFLRSFGSNRSEDLDVVPGGLTNTCNPIDSDKFMILHSSSVQIGPSNNTGIYATFVKPNWTTVKKYVSLNKQLRWSSTSGGNSETPVFFVWWYDSQVRQPGQTFATISSTGQVDTRTTTVTYFREPKP